MLVGVVGVRVLPTVCSLWARLLKQPCLIEHFDFNYGYEANTQNLLFRCWRLVEGAVLVAQKLLLLTIVL